MNFEQLGLPPATRARRLLYSAPAGLVVAYVGVGRDPLELGQLYGKRPTEPVYSKLVSCAPDETIEDPIACPVTPSIYFRLVLLERKRGRWAEMREGQEPEWHQGETTGGWSKGVFRKRLDNGEIAPVVQHGQESDVWISDLHSISGDGRTLYCSAGFFSGPSRKGQYYLCDLSVETGALSRICLLKATFA